MIPGSYRHLWFVLRSHLALRLIGRVSALLLLLLWPRITGVKLAQRAAGCGMLACLLIGAELPFRHFTWPYQLVPSLIAIEFPLGLVMAGVWLALAWGISAMSQVASVGALCLYVAMRLESGVSLLHDGGEMSLFELGVSVLLILTLLHSVRGAAAYKRWIFETRTAHVD